MLRASGLFLILFTLSFLGGCASNLGGDTYSRGEARTPQRVEFGVVEYLRDVQIEGTDTKIGAATGAVLGGIGGSTVGGGRGKAAATVAGAVAGGVAGAAAEEVLTRTDGIEITVRLDNGEILAVVQQKSPRETFRIGERVRLLSVNGVMRVSH